MRDKAVILLSGGLDSLAALGYVLSRNEYDIVIALTFDYGQNAVKQEIIASSNIAKHYNIEHRVIKLDWLKQITKNSLTLKQMEQVGNLLRLDIIASTLKPQFLQTPQPQSQFLPLLTSQF